MTWHYLDGADQKGPISDDDLTSLAARGVIGDNTQVWRDGMSAWQPYGQVKSTISASAAATVATVATAAPAAPAIPAGGVPCAECGQFFPPSEVIRHGDVYICAACKPVFLQKLKEGIAPQGTLNYAGFGVRGGSLILDAILLYIIIIPAQFASVRIFGTSAPIISFLFNICVGVAYYTFFLGKFGATPGKMANKLKVVNPDGTSITYGKAFGRYFAANWVSGMFTLCIGYLIAIWDGQKRALHDRMCSTRVIRK
jgi:uncharacterized RDD family membrane protein YckC